MAKGAACTHMQFKKQLPLRGEVRLPRWVNHTPLPGKCTNINWGYSAPLMVASGPEELKRLSVRQHV